MSVEERAVAIYVAEILGRATAAFAAEDYASAERYANSDRAFQVKLTVLEHNGRALWDGASNILVRNASGDEANRWEAARASAAVQGKLGSAEDEWVCFLINVVDPTAFDSDDDDDGDDGGE